MNAVGVPGVSEGGGVTHAQPWGLPTTTSAKLLRLRFRAPAPPKLLLPPSLQSQFPFVMIINENLEQNTMAALAGKRELSSVKQGDIIFRAGELGDKLFGVVSG